MSLAAMAGAGWGAAGGLGVALIITLWVLTAVLSLLRKVSERPPPTDGADVLQLDRADRARAGARS